jgi:hypothetical protein
MIFTVINRRNATVYRGELNGGSESESAVQAVCELVTRTTRAFYALIQFVDPQHEI